MYSTSRSGLPPNVIHRERTLGAMGIPQPQGPAPVPVAEQNKQKTSKAGLGNHQLKEIYIPDALRNISEASRIEGQTNSLQKMNGCGPRGATFFISSMANKQGPKDQGEGLQWCVVWALTPCCIPSGLPTWSISPGSPWIDLGIPRADLILTP